MVRLFGLKLGSDKKKKAAEAQAQAQQYRRLNPQASEHNLSWRSQRQEALMSSSGRNPGSETPYGGSVISLLEPGPFTTSNLNPALRSFKSEANLPGLGGLRNANMSSSSLALPPVLFGDDDGRLRSRPGSAQSIHSVRSMGGGWRSASKLSNLKAGNLSSTSLALPPDLAGDGARSPASSGSRPGSSQSNRDPAGAGRRPHLDVKTSNLNPPSPSSGPLPSPLGRYELASPVGSDAESLLGDEPGKVADQIASRIVREEKLAKASGAGPAPQPQPRPRPAQAGIPEVRHPPQMKASETQRKYSGPTRQPSPQARGGDERNMPSFLVPGAHTNRKPDASPTHHTSHSLGRATDVSFRDTSQGHISHDWRQRYGLGDDGASHHGRVGSTAQEASITATATTTREITALNSTEADQARHRGGSNVDSAHRDKSQQRPHPRKPEQGATVPGPTSPRSPLFRQRSPFDDARSDSDQDQDLYSTGRNASHAPYGIPSPPLSHRHQLSDDNTTTNNNDDNSSGTPIYRTVEAKRDTVLVGGPGRESLGLQIEKLEKSLHQAQAMSALELKQEAMQNRSRVDSDASSNYSEISERALTFEQPMHSPKPFPLSPRPTDTADRPDDAPATAHPTLQIPRPSIGHQPRQRSADASMPRRVGSPATPQTTGPRLGANNSGRPPLGQRAHTGPTKPPPSPGLRTARPGADEYGTPFRKHGNNHSARGSFGQGPSPFAMGAVGSEQYAKDGVNSDNSTPATSPGLVASYSVFSPPPTGKRLDGPTSQPAKHDWYGPALTSPPTTPLPTPENTNRAKYFPDSAQNQPRSQNQPPQRHQPVQRPPGSRPELTLKADPHPVSATASAGLASSPIIAPMAAGSSWPLPSPNVASFDDSAAAGEAGFSARRNLQPAKRAPPAPLNLTVAKHTDDNPAQRGPWTAGLTVEQATTTTTTTTTTTGTDLAERRMTTGGHEKIVDMYAEGLGESTDYYYYRRRNYYQDDGEDSIGVARGPSFRYTAAQDLKQDDDEMVTRGRTRTRQSSYKNYSMRSEDHDEDQTRSEMIVPTVAVTNDETSTSAYDQLRQPNHGMRSPTGTSDEQGTRFI